MSKIKLKAKNQTGNLKGRRLYRYIPAKAAAFLILFCIFIAGAVT